MPRFVQGAPATNAGDAQEVFGGVVLQGNLAHALLVVRDTDPPTVLRQVRIEDWSMTYGFPANSSAWAAGAAATESAP